MPSVKELLPLLKSTINESQKGKKLRNSAIFINDGIIEKVVHKHFFLLTIFLMNIVISEPNTEFGVVEFKGQKLAITICEDLWDDQPTNNSFSKSKLYITSRWKNFQRC